VNDGTIDFRNTLARPMRARAEKTADTVSFVS
jgi:hypothetical protein